MTPQDTTQLMVSSLNLDNSTEIHQYFPNDSHNMTHEVLLRHIGPYSLLTKIYLVTLLVWIHEALYVIFRVLLTHSVQLYSKQTPQATSLFLYDLGSYNSYGDIITSKLSHRKGSEQKTQGIFQGPKSGVLHQRNKKLAQIHLSVKYQDFLRLCQFLQRVCRQIFFY